MSKAPPPLLGFNNNVRHRGRVFHIQTEDSGVRAPRIVTHLFADGGRIVKTTRTDYTVHIGTADMATRVRGMMKDQHKAMFASLRAGELDALLEQVCGPLEAVHVEPASVKLAPPVAQVVVQGGSAATESASRPSEKIKKRQRALSNPNLHKAIPSVAPPAAQAFDLDVAALEQLPPKSSRAAEPSPQAKAAETAEPGSSPRKSRPSSRPPKAKQKPPPLPPKRPSAARNGIPPPPPAAAAAARNSLFGDDVISEKSLDEVILSYLAEDLDGSQGD